MSKFDHNKWIKDFKSARFLNEAKESYKIMRLVNGRTKELIEGTIEEIMDRFSKAIDKLRDSGSGKKFKNDPKSIEELVYYLNAAQQYIEKKDNPKNTYAIKESINEAPQSEFGIEDAPDLQTELQSYVEEVERVAEEVRDLEQFIAGRIDRYEDETGDMRVSQLRNQAARYIQSSEKNLDGLLKALNRAQKGNA